MKLSDLAALPLTYSEVGATAGTLPAGYHHVQKSAVIGRGRQRFEDAAASGMRWGMLRGAGVKVEATTEVAAVGSEVIVGLGPVQAPCRVVYVVDEPDRRGFAYGTLPGHAESGEELFLVRYDARDREGVCGGDGVFPACHVVEPPGLARHVAGAASGHHALSGGPLTPIRLLWSPGACTTRSLSEAQVQTFGW